MAQLACCADGNFTSSSTWAVVDTTDIAGTDATYLDSESGAATLSTTEASNRAASGFTPGAITIDGIGVKLAVRIGTTGTMTVRLYNLTDAVAVTGTDVQINVADLPVTASSAELAGGWIFFKFASPVTLTAAKAYVISPVTSTATMVQLFRDATASNWSRYLRTTTTAAPAAGDNMIVTREYTAAGASTTRTVTMNETATTDYGSAPTAANSLLTPGLAVCTGGAVNYGTTAATAYYLKMSNSITVYSGGTFTMGTTGTKMPRDSSAVLEFDPAADGDYGFHCRNGSTVTFQGQSRTSGKDVVSAKLNVDYPSMVNNVLAVSLSVAGSTVSNQTSPTLDPTGTSPLAVYANNTKIAGVADTAAATNHMVSKISLTTINAATTVTAIIWIERGTGTNNRFVRLQVGNAAGGSATHGFYTDLDLLSVSASAVGVIGSGTAGSASISAFLSGYICKVSGTVGATIAAVMSTMACNASGVVSYSGDATQCFITGNFGMFESSSPDLDIGLDTDTGWLSGDIVAIASTSRTISDCDLMSLSANAGASSVTLSLPLHVAHSGTSPTQAEVILLTRNVKLRSASSAIMTYFQINDGATVDIDWVEFYYLGQNSSGKRGIETLPLGSSNAWNLSIQFSSVHDCENSGFQCGVNTNTITNYIFSSNVMWNCGINTGPAFQFNSTFAATNWFVTDNIIIRTQNLGGFVVGDAGGTFTGNTAVGTVGSGIFISEGAVIGTFGNLTAHSCTGVGITCNSQTGASVISGGTIWRNSSTGVSGGSSSCTFEDFIMFGNTVDNINPTAGAQWTFINLVSNGDTTFATSNGVRCQPFGQPFVMTFIDCDFSTVTGIKTAHTNDIVAGNNSGSNSYYLCQNCKFGGTSEVIQFTNLSPYSYVASDNHDQVAGAYKCWVMNGVLSLDSTIFHTAAPSMRMAPEFVAAKTESAPIYKGIKVPVANGDAITISVYLRKSTAGDGEAYSGNQPRLIVRESITLGISADTVLDTMTVGTGSWEQLSGTTATVTDDGVLEFIVDCDGTTGWVNVDDWAAS